MGATAAATAALPGLAAGSIDGLGQLLSAPNLSGTRTIARFPAGSGAQELGLATAPWQMADGAASLVARRDGSIAILDTLNKRVSIVRGGNVVETIEIPGLGYALDIEEVGGRLFVLDMTNAQVVTIEGHTIRRQPLPGPSTNVSRLHPGSRPGRIAVVEADGGAYDLDNGNSSTSTEFQDQQGGRNHIEYSTGFLDRRQATLGLSSGARVSILTNGFLGSVVPAGRDDRGRYYVVVSEIDIHAPGTDVDLTLRRFEPDGTPAGVARVPVRGRATNPRSAVAFAPNGDAFALFMEQSQTLLLQLDWQARVSPLVRIPIAPMWLRNAANAYSSIPTSRQDASTQAMAYTTQSWYASATNLQARTRDCNNTVITTQVPRYLAGTPAGWKTGLPYCWGAYNLIQGFLDMMNAGWMAGNVYCTGNYKCGTYGNDCSGYVQQCWNVGNPKYSVASLWSTFVAYGGSPASSGALSTGDIFAYLPNYHVRMHNTYANWNGQMYLGNYMYESADPAWDDRITYAYRAWSDYPSYSWGVTSFMY
jgi:hypothetical protein